MKRHIWFALLLVLIHSELIDAQDIYFNHLRSDQPIGNITNNSICQDKQGMIWIGTREGLRTYDGVQLKEVIPFSDNGSDRWIGEVKMLHVDTEGKIYMLTENKLTYYDPLTEKFHSVSDSIFSALCLWRNNIYVATKNVIYSYSKGELSPFARFEGSYEITYLLESTASSTLLVGTRKNGLYAIDVNGKISCINPFTDRISTLFEDSKKNIWVGTWESGLYQINSQREIAHFDSNSKCRITGKHIRTIVEDNTGAIWIGAMNGLHRLQNEKVTHFGQVDNNVSGLTNISVWSLFKDRQGSIWIGTYFGGVYHFNPQYENYTYHLINNSEVNQQLLFAQIAKDKHNNFWIASEGNGLLCYNPLSKSKTWYRASSSNPNSISHNNIKGLLYDSDLDCLWICTHLGGITRLDCSTRKATRIHDPANPALSSEIIRAAVKWNGIVIFATHSGIYTLTPGTSQFSRLTAYPANKIATALFLRGNELWVGTTQGLFYINLKNNKTESYNVNPDGTEVLSSQRPNAIFVTSQGKVWIGTEYCGLLCLDPNSRQFTRLNSKNSSIEGDAIYTISQSRSGYLLVATNKGLTQIDVEHNKIYNHSYHRGFPLASMNPGGIYRDEQDNIFCSGSNGIISIPEDKLLPQPKDFTINLYNLYVNNKLVTPNDETKILKQSFKTTNRIILTHNESNIQIGFATDNYIQSNELLYEYQLKGFNDNWIPITASEKINFTNIPPGSYTLTLRVYNPNFDEFHATRSLDIYVKPPFYKAWYAFLFYILLIGGGIRWYIRSSKSKLLLQTSLILAQKEKEQNEASNQSKLRFFTNISHEFRTPITLILGQLQMLMESTSIQPALYNRIVTIYRNASKMQDLISELLDFRKQEQGFLKLQVGEYNLVNYVAEIYTSFKEYASFKEIEFVFDSLEQEILVWIDANQYKKVLTNIISNAFKYTNRHGAIKIQLEKGEKSAFIHVHDTGIGIPQEVLSKIFDRFYQVENLSEGINIGPATGIGLALAKGIVEAHKGSIQVRTEERIGSIFTIEIRLGEEHFEGDPTITRIESINIDHKIIETLRQEVRLINADTQSQIQFPKESTILIVEDNEELRQLLSELFAPFSTILTAENGEEGLQLAHDQQPDLIISDVMMPLLSGNEMCSRLKSDASTSHIPIILLTALSSIEQTIEGYKTGADDYISKPFNTSLLITRCRNILQNKRLLREKYCRQIDARPDSITSSNLDQKFLEEAIQIVENHINDENFNVHMFARKMSMGLTSFYAKLKGVTGQTPNDFILMIKLKKAAALMLENQELQISEVCYRFGFSTPKYFTRCFKEQFGVTPSKFRQTKETAS